MIPITIWIVEDDTSFRWTLKRLLNQKENITCDRVFSSCPQLFKAVETEPHPDLILMDLGLPGMGGVEGIRKLSTLAPKITVVVLTVFEEKKTVFQALDAGAAGYLLKTATGPEIIRGLKQVFMGGAALSPSVAKLVLEQFHKPSPSQDFHLTEREIDVLEELAKGLAIKEIADVLSISRHTVATHLEKIYAKLHVQSQSGAVAKALRSGII